MIKTYRNGLLAAAIAFTVASCGGASDENPLTDPKVGENVGNEDKATLQGIADLIGGLVLEIMGTGSVVFDTISVVSDGNTSVGKLLGNGSSAAPVGVKTVVGAPCGGNAVYPAGVDEKDANYFELGVLLEIDDKDDSSKKVTPQFTGLAELATGNLKTNLDMKFRTCNEPKHTYDDDDTNEIISDETRVLDGGFVVVLSTETNIAGEAANKKDFELTGKVSMDNYFVQTDVAKKPDVISGGFNISLVTDNVDAGNYTAYIYGNITTNEASKDGYNILDFTADGQLGLDETDGIEIKSYDVLLKGNITSTIPGSTGSYRLFTEGTLQKTAGSADGIYPTSGKIGIVDKNTGYIHYATADADGLNYDLQQDDGTRKDAKCTWDEIDNDTCDVTL